MIHTEFSNCKKLPNIYKAHIETKAQYLPTCLS